MAEIVSGLFGPSPQEEYRRIQDQQNAIALQAFTSAAGSPGQLKAQAYANMGGGAVRGGMGMMGIEPTAVVQAKQQQAIMQGADTQTPEGLMEIARRFNDARMPQQAHMAVQAAAQMKQKLAEAAQAQMKADSDIAKDAAQAKLYDAQAAELGEEKTRETKRSAESRRLIEAGHKEGSPSYNKKMNEWINADIAGRAKGGGATIHMPGAEKLIDIPAFRARVQTTIKPYMVASDAADTSLSMLELAVKENNPTAYQGARVQLAKAFGDSQITAREIEAAGGDPSIWGKLTDTASTWFTGTPTVSTMAQMKKTLAVVKKVAEAKARNEIRVQKGIAKRAGFSEDDIGLTFDFPSFSPSPASAPKSREITLPNGKKVTVTEIP